MSTDMDAHTGAPQEAPVDNSARDRIVIWLLIGSTFVVILNETIMSVALPRLMVALSVSASAVQWLTTAFLLTMATVIPVTGFLIQRINTRPLFILAMTLFSAGTLMGALAPGLEVLILARVVQASGTAIMMPLLMTTIMTLVPADRRGPMMGNISLVISVAPALGPTISGVILEFFTWQYMFWLILPISLFALWLGHRYIANVTEPRYAPIDLISVPISAIAFGGVVYGLSSFGEPAGEGGNGLGLIALGVGVVAMVIFVLRQVALQREDRPLLDLRTFTSRNFAIAVTMMAIAMMVLFGTIILLPIYMQNVRGFAPLETGLLLLPGGLLMGLIAPTVGRLYDKFGPTPLIVPGAVIVSAVLWSMTLLTPETSFWAILAGHLTISVGLALIFTPLFTVSLSSVRPDLYSHGSAVLGSIQQVSGAAGVALLVAVMSATSAARLAEGAEEVQALSSGVTAAFTVGAVLSLLAIVAAVLVRRAPSFDGPPPGH